MADALLSVKGVKHGKLTMTTTGKGCGEPPVTGALRCVVLWLGLILWAAPLHAHDPDAVDLELPKSKCSLIGRWQRPQQFIPDKEYLMQPQGRPARSCGSSPDSLRSNIRVGPERPISTSAGLMRTMAPMSRSSLTACRSICEVMPMAGLHRSELHHSGNH